MDWLKVTNFEFDCRFLKSAAEPKYADNLRKCVPNDLYYGLCTLHDDTRPYVERPKKLVWENTYIREYSQRVHAKIPSVLVALEVVRDLLIFTGTRYDEKTYQFTTQMKPALDSLIVDEMFDFPNFEPFRYAYKLIKEAEGIAVRDRTSTGGDFSYQIQFKVVDEATNAGEHRAIRLRDYIDKFSPNFPSS